MSEFDFKQDRIQSLLSTNHLDALVLLRVSSFAWATCGAASYVNTATSDGASSLLITPAGHYIITNNIEAPRLEQEENLAGQGWELRIAPWHEANSAVAELTRDLRLGADVPFTGAADLSNEVAHLRSNLTPEEGERFRMLGQICAEAMDNAARSIHPGQTEYEIAGVVARETTSRGAQPIVNLIATDERIFKFRHPLPTAKKLDRYAMIVLCGRKWGLVASITRLVYFGRLPEELRHKAEACGRIDSVFITETRPGRSLGDIFQSAQTAYSNGGFPDEWQLHHQGGPAAYEPREYLATPESTEKASLGQAYAWNPSITGTKSEDTILVGPTDNEILTAIDGWPALAVDLPEGKHVMRPAILELE
jgi:Xaa-Pro aminopeptidase